MSTETLASSQGAKLSPHVYPEWVRLDHPLTSRGCRNFPSRGSSFTPPISLPFAPSNATDGTPVHRTRPVRKSDSIDTLQLSSSPRTPSSSNISPLPALRSSAPPIMGDGFIHATKPASSSTISSTHPQLVLSTSQGHTARVIFPPRRWHSLPLAVTTEHAVQESTQSDFLVPSPLQEEPPSPATAKRKQYSKLRRHLGASIPPELVYKDKGVVASSPDTAPVLEYVPEDELDNIYIVAHGSHEEEDSSEESEGEESGESGESEESEALEIQWEPPADSSNVRRENGYCGKWMREQGGRRWLVSNYEDVIQALRDL